MVVFRYLITLKIILFLFLIKPVLLTGQSAFKVKFSDEHYLTHSVVTAIEESKDNQALLFSVSTENELTIFKIDSCGNQLALEVLSGNSGKMELYDVESYNDQFWILLQDREDEESFVLVVWDEINGITLSKTYNLHLPVIPNSIKISSEGKWAVSLDYKVGNNHSPVLVLGEVGAGIVSTIFVQDFFNIENPTLPFTSGQVAFLGNGDVVLFCHNRMILLNEMGSLKFSKRLEYEGLGGENARFIDVGPVVLNDRIYIVCQSSDLSKHILSVNPEGFIIDQSQPFSFYRGPHEFGFLIGRTKSKFDLFVRSDSLLLLAGQSYSFNSPAKPVIYTWDEQLKLVGYVSIISEGDVLSTLQSYDNSVRFALRKPLFGFTMISTTPELYSYCNDNFEFPDTFLQIEKVFILKDDSLSISNSVNITEGTFQLSLSSRAPSIPETLCQTYYGPPLPDIVIDTFICLGAEIDLKYTHPTGTVVWEDGSMDSLFHVTEPGVYRATVHHCGTTQQVVFNVPDGKCPCVFEVPNAFTPNGDGINDSFGPVYQCYFADYLLRVFNRWGQEVFTSTDPAQGWDGRIDGKEAPSEVYMWHATYTAWHEGQLFSRSASGEVTLLR